MCCISAVLGYVLISPKSHEPKQVQDDLNALRSMQGKGVSACLSKLKSSDERQRWAAACELSKDRQNRFLPEVHHYIANSKDLHDSATLALTRELVIQRTRQSEVEMASLVSSNPDLAQVVAANYLDCRDSVPRFQSWLERQTDPRVLEAFTKSYSQSPSPLGRSLFETAKRRLKELS